MLQGYLHAALRSPGNDAPGKIDARGRIVCSERRVDCSTAQDIVMYRNAYACNSASRSQSPSTSASPCSRTSPGMMQQQKLVSGQVRAVACTLGMYAHSMATHQSFEIRSPHTLTVHVLCMLVVVSCCPRA